MTAALLAMLLFLTPIPDDICRCGSACSPSEGCKAKHCETRDAKPKGPEYTCTLKQIDEKGWIVAVKLSVDGQAVVNKYLLPKFKSRDKAVRACWAEADRHLKNFQKVDVKEMR